LCAAATQGDELLVWRDETVIVLLNRFPYNPGHLLVAPTEHSADYATLADAPAAALDRATRRAVRAIGRALNPDGYNVGINLGRSAGAGLPGHLHVHVVPRWSGDSNFMPVVADTRVLPELLADTAAKLRPHFAE
jgi:ATP adenylyltransferase